MQEFEVREKYRWSMRHTRGDSAELIVPIVLEAEDGTKTPYDMADGDSLTITLRRSMNAPVALEKTFVGTNVITIDPTDTDELDVAPYVFDVELTLADGRKYTLNDGEHSKWRLLGEVTR